MERKPPFFVPSKLASEPVNEPASSRAPIGVVPSSAETSPRSPRSHRYSPGSDCAPPAKAASYLIRRRGILFFRSRIPNELRPVLGLTEYRRSLTCKAAGVDIEQFLLGVYPLRSGQHPILPEEPIRVRVLTPNEALPLWANVFAVLYEGLADGEGEFVPGKTLRLQAVRLGPQRMSGSDMDAARLTVDSCATDIAALQNASRWRMYFDAPLRLARPEGTANSGHRFCDAPWFAAQPQALHYLLGRIRFLPPFAEQSSLPVPCLVASDLTWVDMQYNRERQIALGGVVGTLTFTGAPELALAERLVLGQYTGLGKNSRFGLGYYRLEDIRH